MEQDEAYALDLNLDLDLDFHSGFVNYHYELCQLETVYSYRFHCCKLPGQTASPDKDAVVNEGEHA